MPKCQSCGKEWSWIQTNKNIFGLKCPYCKNKQYISKSSRNRTAIFSFLPAMILLMNLFFDLSWPVIVALFVLIPVITLSIYPFMVKLSNEEELPWQ